MTLYKRMILVFIGVAVIPLVIFAAVAREEALGMADVAAGSELLSGVNAVSRVLEREAALAEGLLRTFANLAPEAPAEDFLSRVMASPAGPSAEGFQRLTLLDPTGRQVASVGEVEAGAVCHEGRLLAPVQVEVPLPDGAGRLVGDYRAGTTAAMSAGTGFWVFDRDGSLIVATNCQAAPDVSPSGLPPDSPSGVVGRPQAPQDASAGGESLVFARVPRTGWTVLATGSSQLRAPLAGFFRDYWLFVLALACTTLLAFSFFLRPITGYVEDLTHAVERVAAGDLRPWFPTPRDDEVGRLGLAFQDMTEHLRDMVSQVERSSRLAILGKLSAYLAHEIRNPLSSVKMNLQRLQRWQNRGEIPERFRPAVEISLKEVGRLSAAVSNILQLSPSKARPKEVVSLHELVAEVGQLLDSDFARRRVNLRWDLTAEADRVLGEPGQLKGVIINLMLNALDAQPEGGELRVQSRLQAGDGDSGGPILELRFRDRGPGIPPDVRERIFEPFFTTKGGGSGIGLAVASQTVRDHGGEIQLADRLRVGDGAEFIVRLPLAALVTEGGRSQVEPGIAPWMEESSRA